MSHYTLAAIAEQIKATIYGDGDTNITGIATLNSAEFGQISFLDNLSYKSYLATTKASAVILKQEFVADCPTAALIVDEPYLSYAKVANLFANNKPVKPGIHPTAIIDPSAEIASTATVGAYCVIGANVKIAAHTVVGPHGYIGEQTIIGAHGYLAPKVTIYKNTIIGQKVIIHSGAIIASDGFGYANDKGSWYKIPQLGGIVIGDEVEIGANSCIDRGALADTIIGKGVKIDNLVQIAHNVLIGDHTAIAACVAIAGSVKIGKHCMIGGCSAIAGHLEIADRVYLTGKAMVTTSIKQSGIYSSGTGLQPNKEWHKSVVRFRQLDKIARKVVELERRFKP